MRKATLLFVFLLGIMTVTCFAQDKDASEYRALAEKGDAEAQFNLGRCYAKEENYTEAVKWYMKAAEQNYADAQCILGNYYYHGWAEPEVQQDYAEAAKWYREAAEQGFADAQCNLGICYEFGEGVPQNYEEAVKWYRKAAEQNYARAQCCLGVCYDNKIGVPQDYEEAIKWYTKAAEQGYAEAQNNLGWCYYNGNGVKLDYNEAFNWFTKAADNGSTIAMINIGDMYCNDFYVNRDYEKAEKYYMKAVNKGNSNAMIAMGDLCYYASKGRQAEEWYKLAIEQGNPEGYASLANWYDGYNYTEYGDTLRQHTEYLWHRAAENGSARAQAVVGFINFIEKNFDEAMKWYAMAKRNGALMVNHSYNIRLPIDIAIMLCEHFKRHNTEYDFSYSKMKDLIMDWWIDVYPMSDYDKYEPEESNYVYVKVEKNGKCGLIKLTKEGKLLEKTPIIYDYNIENVRRSLYDDDKETILFQASFNGQTIQFDL